jgi:hypothetical protein
VRARARADTRAGIRTNEQQGAAVRVDDFTTARAWHEPAEPQDDGIAPAPAAAPSPAPAPAVPFWSDSAAPAAPNTLSELAPPPLQPAAAPPAPAAAPAPPPASSSAYVGEQAVDRQWLADREAALVAIRRDYEGARAAAQAQPGGAGWRAATMVTDESGQVRSASGNAAVFVADPNAAPELIGYDESGAALTRPGGQWLEFDEAAFAATYRAQDGAPLQALAAQYGTDSATLFAQHPELWGIATGDHALNAGPPPAGRAIGDAAQLGTLDLYLADPQIRALIDAYGGSAAPASGGVALEQQRIYGTRRYEELTKLGQAMQSVRDQYADALAQAQASGSGPGWIDRPRTVTVADESGATHTEPAYVTDESGARLLDANGQPQVVNEHVFDVDAFTAWYTQQPGLANQAFGSFYGASHTQYGTDEAGQRVIGSSTFDNASWNLVGGRMAHRDLVSIDPNRPPELNDNNAVGFDLEAGWATHQSNIHEDRDWFETIVQVAIVAAVTYVSAGTLGPAVAGAVGVTSTVGVGIVSAAVAGAAGSAVSGAMNGNLSLKGVLQGALAGGLSAGLMSGIGGALNITSPVGTLALRTTVQGGIQAMLGGSFKDGALAGFASGLAQLASDGINTRIDEAVANGTMGAGEAIAARTFSKVVGSAIRAAGNPDDPQYAFASAFLDDLVREAGEPTPVTRTAFDDDGNLMPGIVDPNATPAQQQAQLAAHLERQGFSADEALAMAGDALPLGTTALLPPSAESRTWTNEELRARLDEVDRRLALDLAAQEERDASLLSPEDLMEPTGGPGGSRAPLQPVLNGRFDAALNAAADVLGLGQPLTELQGALAQLQTAQVEARIDGMRNAMRSAGVDVAPDYEVAWDANGRIVRDYGATIDKLQRAYDDFLTDRRYTESFGADWRNVRIGRSALTVPEFEARTLQIQQKAADDAFQRGRELIATGQLALKNNDYALTLGGYVDEQVRLTLRRYGTTEGLPDSGASNLYAVNRQLRSGGMIGVPDLRIGNNLFSDTTLARKDGTTDQLRRWNEMRPNDTLIIRPSQIGGSYVVPRSTIKPLTPPGKGS